MKLKPLKRRLATFTILTTVLLGLSYVWLMGDEFKVHAGEAFESPDDFEDVIGYVEWDSWGNFSAEPGQNPPPAAKSLSAEFLALPPAQRLLSAGRCEAVFVQDEGYILANFKMGTRAYARYSITPLGQVKAMAMYLQTEDEGGWELGDKEISLFSGSEEDLVERGPAMADTSRAIVTIREDGTADGMSFATMPTTSNYTLDKKEGFNGYGLEAGGDKSLNDIGQAIAEASGVTFNNMVNSTQEAVVTHDDGENIIDLLFVTYDEWSASALAGKAQAGYMSILRRFTHRIKVSARKVKNFAKGVATAPYKGLTFIAGKAKTLVSKVGKTAMNTLKAGITFIPNLLKSFSKWLLIPIIGIGAIVIIFALKKYRIL